MIILTISLLLAFATLVCISLQKTYAYIPQVELKRRARGGDEFADLLYRAAAYGSSLQALLWTMIGLSSAGFFVIVSASAPSWLALLASLVLLWVGYAWLPRTSLSKTNKFLAKYFTPPITWLLGHIYPIVSRVAEWVERHGRINIHTGLYEKEDFVNLLKTQKSQPDNRIPDNELTIAINALSFGDKIVRDIMTPRRVVKSVKATDSIGPVLMDELHDTGHSRFPVYQDKQDNVVGVLYLRDLIDLPHGGQVRDVMDKKAYYVHEEQTLAHALQAFLKTKHHLFVVVNAFEEVVGIVSIEDILEQIIGKQIVDEFDKYDDLREVAQMLAKQDRSQNSEKVVE